ncbi:MAG: hypothetical protein E2O36_02600 [Proteobacteria bacterium]|nr:MAG: hypothetical protein E2O36_02600 [Pseudomonadota bacterium]
MESYEMNKSITSIILVALMSTTPLAMADDGGALDLVNFSGNVALGTDSIWRGETQNDNQIAISGGFDWGYGNFSLGVWASSVDFTAVTPDTNLTVNVYGGYATKLGPFDVNVDLYSYLYPGSDDAGAELDYFEAIPKIGYTFAESTLEPSIYVQYGYSPDYFGEEGTGHNVEGGLGLTLPMGFGVDGAIGHQSLDGDVNGTKIKWTYWNVGVTYSVLGFDLDARYHGADENSDILWLANDEANEDIVTFTVSRSF